MSLPPPPDRSVMVGWFARLPLRVLLTLPFVLMVALLAGAVGWLSYNAGRDAVDEFSGQLLVSKP